MALKTSLSPPPTHTHTQTSNSLMTDPMRWFCCGSLLPVFVGGRVLVSFHHTCFHIILSSVSVAEWPPFCFGNSCSLG